MIGYQLSQDFGPYLFPHERVLWTGKPKQGLMVSGKDSFLIPFSLMWGGFAIFWNYGVWGGLGDGDGAPWFFRLWGLPFLVAGLYLIVGRFIHDAMVRKSLKYAVTDQRILVLRKSNMTSLDIHRLPRIMLSEHSDGTGTLSFETGTADSWFAGAHGWNWWVPALDKTSQFFRIQDPRRVYEIVRNQDV